MTTITVNTSVNLSLDESAGLQNLTATPTPAGDADDNDILVSSLPAAFLSRLMALGAPATTVTTKGAALSGYTGTGAGSNIISVAPTPGGTITDLGLVGSDGAPLNGLDSGLDTLTGVNILLYTDTNNNIVLGRAGAADGPVVFAIYLEETGGTPPTGAKMWSVQYAPLKNPDATNPDDSLNLADKVFVSASEDLNFSLANAPSGNNLFVMFGDTNVAIVVTGKAPADQSGGASVTTGDTIVTSQGGGTTTIGVNNQMFDPPAANKAGEGAYFTFVTGANSDFTVPNLSPTEANAEGNILFNDVFEAQAATFTVSQLQPANKAATLKISAKTTDAESGVNFVNGLGDADDHPVPIDQVKVYNASGALIENSDGSVNDANVSITFASGTATISGLKSNYRVEYHTTADSSRVLIENVGSSNPNLNSSFDIGGFKLLQVSSAKVEIGSKVSFEDDGPSISTTGTEPTLTVDETVLATNDTKNFAANFTSAFGVDGAGTLVFALGISASEKDSGLVDTTTGNHVFLFLNAAGVVEGREGTDAAAAAEGAIVFTVTAADNGDVTLDQLRAVVHPDTTNPDDSKSLSDNLVTLTGTVTDKDGDSRNASLNIGANLVFKDDGPSISTTGTEPTLTVDETVLATNDTKNFAANFTSAFGADGAGTLVFALGISASEKDSGLVDTTTGNHVFLFLNAAGMVEGREGTDAAAAADGAIVFTVTAADNGDVTLDQLRAVVHPDATNPDDSKNLSADNLVTLTGTITDKDGDSRSAALNIGSNLVFKDDGPAVSANAAVKLDDDALAGGNAGGTGDDINAENATGTLGHTFGADGGSIAYLTTGAPAGFTYEKSGDDLLVRQGTTTVLTLTLNAATGAYTVTQNAPITHAGGLDENNAALTVNYQVTDKDGDTANGTLSVNVDDDTPTLDFGNLVGTGTILPQYGEWNGSAGADKPGNLDLALNQFQLVRPDGTTIAGSGFAFAEQAGSPNAAGDYLFAGSLTADFDNNASTANTTNNFTLTAFHDGKYAFDLAQPFGSTITFSSANGSLGAGGPDPVQTLTIPPDEQVVFFGVQATTSDSNILSAIKLGAPDLTEAQIEAANFSFISSQNMNVSTAGIGVGNNNLEGNTTAGINAGDESFVVNPETLLTGMKVFIDNSVGGYDPATEELYYKIFFDDGTHSGNIKVVSGDLTSAAGGQKSFTIDPEGSKLIDSVQLTMGKGTIKVPVIEFIQASENLASDIKLDFTASLTDADSDTATSNFSVDLFANDLPANSYTLLGASSDLDSFDVDLAASQVSYRVEGFDTPDDTLFLLGDSTATVSINNSGADSIVSVAETTGGQTTVITVVGADLLTSNIVLV